MNIHKLRISCSCIVCEYSMISERLDVEPICEEEEEQKLQEVVAGATLKEPRTAFYCAQSSSESVPGAVNIKTRAEGTHASALAVEVEVPPAVVTHQGHSAVPPTIVLTAPDEEDYELFPSCTNSVVSTASNASSASCQSTMMHSGSSLPARSPTPSSTPSRLSISSEPPPSGLSVHSIGSYQPFTSRPPSIGSILEEPILEGEIVEQCLYDYSGGDGNASRVTQFAPESTENTEKISLVAIPESENDVHLFKGSEPATRSYRTTHTEGKPRAMSFPEVLSDTTHRGGHLWEHVRLLTRTREIEPLQQATKRMAEIEVDDQERRDSSYGVQKVSDVIMRAKKWRKKALATKETEEDSKMNTEEMRPEEHARRRAMIEIPQAIRVELLTEAHSILQRTLKMYQTALGLSHPLTNKTSVKLNELQLQLDD